MESKTNTAKSETSVLFGEWLIQCDLITQDQLCQALSYQQENGCRVGESLVARKLFTKEQITKALS